MPAKQTLEEFLADQIESEEVHKLECFHCGNTITMTSEESDTPKASLVTFAIEKGWRHTTSEMYACTGLSCGGCIANRDEDWTPVPE